MYRHSLVLFLLVLAIACGGGASSSSQPESVVLKIDMVYPTTPREKPEGVRQKFAVIDENTPFRIGTDTNDVADPLNATHARARLFQSGNLVAEGMSKIIRYTTDPSSVDPASRKIVVRGVPTGVPLFLNLELGKDLGVADPPYTETIYYAGNVNHILIGSSNLVVGGNVESSIKVPLRPAVSDKFYQLQCYVDFSTLPLIKMEEVDKKASTIVNVNALDGREADIQAPPPQFISDNIFNFQAFFFELSEIPLNQNKLDVTVEFGGNINLLAGGLILPNEAIAGLPLLFDFETSYVRMLTRLHEDASAGRSSGNFLGVYREMVKAYARADNLMRASGNTHPMEVQAQDLALLQVGYEIAKLCSNNTVGNRQRFSKVDKFQNEVMSGLRNNALAAIDFFLFSGNKSVPLKVNFDANSGNTSPLYILGSVSGNNRVDSSGNIYSAENNNLGSANFLLSTLVNDRIVTPYYDTTKIWTYIESFTKLATITSDNVNK